MSNIIGQNRNTFWQNWKTNSAKREPKFFVGLEMLSEKEQKSLKLILLFLVFGTLFGRIGTKIRLKETKIIVLQFSLITNSYSPNDDFSLVVVVGVHM